MQERELPRTWHRKVMKIQVKPDNDTEWKVMLSKGTSERVVKGF